MAHYFFQRRTAYVADLAIRDDGPVKTFVSNWWTLEYDLAVASWTMAGLMHRAVKLASIAERSWPDGAKTDQVIAQADEDIDEWKGQDLTLEQVALKIYKPLKRDRVSKSITAQYLTSISLAESHVPPYLVDAFKYLCGEVAP